MKQVLTSAGLVALGAATLYAYDPEMSRQQSGRPFSISATVRGFYDDNINTQPSKFKEDSFGFQISPAIHANLSWEQTYLSLGYVYSLYWYEDRDPNRIDQSHEFSAKLRHQFGPRHTLGVDDSFVVTSEPTVVDRFGIVTSPVRTRTRSSVFQNRGAIEDNIGITPVVTASFGYVNNWYDYEAEGDGSRSALLDRIEHLIRADGRYQFNPKLIGVVGYSLGFSTYTGDELLAADGSSTLQSKDRDSLSHYGYVGVDYDITAKLRTSVRVGAQFTDYHRVHESSANPYAEASLSYLFMTGTSGEIGVRHSRNATDVAAVDTHSGRPTLDAETTAVFGQFQHRIIGNLTGNLIGQFQHSTYNDGVNDNQTEDLWLFGVNLSYIFDRHWSAEVGYNYDQLDSNLKVGNRSYDRNRVYIGVTARY